MVKEDWKIEKMCGLMRERERSLPFIKWVDIEAENCPPIICNSTIDIHLHDYHSNEALIIEMINY